MKKGSRKTEGAKFQNNQFMTKNDLIKLRE
jgi:hypothetical protein